MSKTTHQEKQNRFSKFLSFVEWLGNLLPHPVTLFAYFTLGIILFSGFAHWIGLEVTDPRPIGAAGRSADGIIRAVSLLSGDGIRWLYQNLVLNFTDFAPLGTVLVALLGVGVAEGSGLIRTAVRSFILKAPRSLVTFNLVFAGILSNTAAELGYVVLIPLGGYIFKSIGRHPFAGMAATFAGVSGGYSANLLIGTVDPLLAGITQEAAQLVDPNYSVHAAVNWYFMIASTFLISIVGTWITEKIVEPKLGKYDESHADEQDQSSSEALLQKATAIEKKGMKLALLSIVILSAILYVSVAPSWGILRNPDTGEILKSPFLKGIVSSIFIFFLIPGIIYGKVTGTFKNDDDVIASMAKSMSTMGLYIVIVFAAAQFINCFKWTNLGLIFAVKGAQWMQMLGLEGGLIFFPFILVCALINLSLGSASAQWAATAPIFVPMLMLLGFSPEVIQAAYRIGDSTTNIITPMMSYFGLILAFAYRFDKRTGVGTIISTMLPYSLIFLISWSLLFYVWVFVFGLPVGPGAPTYFTP